ncbi:GNAT family N-acetyltransferase [Ideonella sp. YS5]|uniref:GNAT family N-acetyltransferase n=1 Tax=Ideonella sp. YS5 TaxID=3453714 RepID=UPI003EEC24C0
MQSQPCEPNIFESKRLHARRIGPADAPAMHRVYGDAGAMRWVGDGQPLDLAQCEHWVEVTLRNYAERGYGMFALASRESGEVIGFCGLVHPGGQREVELKYALRRESWGRGLASEAAAAMLGYAGSVLGIRRVIATTAPDNVASHRVLLKAGMRRGELRANDDGSFTQLFAWTAEGGENAP